MSTHAGLHALRQALVTSPGVRRVFSLLALLGAPAVSAPDTLGSLDLAKTAWNTDVHWSQTVVHLTPVRPAPGSGISARDLLAALSEGVNAWNGALQGCSVPRLVVDPIETRGAALDDGQNLVVVLVGQWSNGRKNQLDSEYDPGLEAITTLLPRRDTDRRDGEIRDADIEINALNFKWSLTGTAPGTRSLRALLAHEVGHVLGLAHSCGAQQHSSTLPQCRVGADAFYSVMYPDPTQPGRAQVLGPSPDAIARLCR